MIINTISSIRSTNTSKIPPATTFKGYSFSELGNNKIFNKNLLEKGKNTINFLKLNTGKIANKCSPFVDHIVAFIAILTK